MNRSAAYFFAAVVLLPAVSVLGQSKVPAKNVSHARQNRVINIFSLPQEPASPANTSATQDTPAKQSPSEAPAVSEPAPVDPFSDLPFPQLPATPGPADGSFSDTTFQDSDSDLEPSEPTQVAIPAVLIPQQDPFQQDSQTAPPSLNDMPLTADPFTQDPVLESLPAPRQESFPQVNPQAATLTDPFQPKIITGEDTGIPSNWINIGKVNAQPVSQSLPRRKSTGLPMATMRRPSPPTPTINVFQPAIIQVPTNIRVLPTYVDVPYVWPAYAPYYHPAAGYYPAANYPGSYPPATYGPQSPGSAGLSGAGQQLDYSYHRATDQQLNYSRDPNLVGFPSHSVNYVGYPLNYLSYPANSHYGLHIQSYPIHRRLDR